MWPRQNERDVEPRVLSAGEVHQQGTMALPHVDSCIQWQPTWTRFATERSASASDTGAAWCGRTLTTKTPAKKQHSTPPEATWHGMTECRWGLNFLSHGKTSDDTCDWRTDIGIDQWMLRSWRSSAKQAQKVFVTWPHGHIDIDVDTEVTNGSGATSSVPTRSSCCGCWWRRWLVVDQRISVLMLYSTGVGLHASTRQLRQHRQRWCSRNSVTQMGCRIRRSVYRLSADMDKDRNLQSATRLNKAINQWK